MDWSGLPFHLWSEEIFEEDCGGLGGWWYRLPSRDWLAYSKVVWSITDGGESRNEGTRYFACIDWGEGWGFRCLQSLLQWLEMKMKGGLERLSWLRGGMIHSQGNVVGIDMVR